MRWVAYSKSNTIFFRAVAIKWAMAVLLCLAVLVYVTIYFLPIMSPPSRVMSPRRSKTIVIYDNKELCASILARNQNTAVIVVLSERHHFNQRNIIRQTYGSIKTANNVTILAVIFMLGNSNKNHSDETPHLHRLEDEKKRFNDVIIGDFEDTYRNLTLKTIMAYEWISTFCREAQLVVKTDDDVLVNIFGLTKELGAFSPDDVISSNIWCTVHRNEDTIKNAASRFYVPPDEFPGGKFPTHCAGLGYVTTMRVIELIVDEISKSFLGRVCTHEDVFMTSVVPMHMDKTLNISGQHSDLIKLVDKHEWTSFYFENGSGDKDNFLENALRQISNENLNKFRKAYDEKLFYLFAHTNDFEEKYLRLWRIIEKTFSR